MCARLRPVTRRENSSLKRAKGGHFVFAKVPPGHRQLVHVIEVPGTPSPTGMVWTDQTLTNVDIRPGETTTVTVNAARP
jgi:hypothetical protein